jgi:O-antigen/teichoic acid export membrane protein
LLAAATAVLLGYGVLGIVAALVLAAGATLAGTLWFALRKTSLRPARTRSREEVREFLFYSLPAAASRIGSVLRKRVDVFLVGVLLSAGAAGIYNVALFLSSFISLSLVSFNQLFPPVASRLYSQGNVRELDAAYSVTTRWILSGALVIATSVYVYRRELLGLFGTEYAKGSLVLSLFVVGQLVNSAVGPAGWLLQMTDHQYLNALNNWILGVLNVAFSYYLVLELGLIGAAVGTAGSLAIVNVVRVLEIWHLEGLFPYTSRFFKPIVASVGMGTVMVALGTVLSGPTLLVVGIPGGVATFLFLLRLFGIEQRDRQLVSLLVSRYRTVLR